MTGFATSVIACGCEGGIEKELQKGAEKAKVIARGVLQRVRQNIGY